MKKAFIVEYCIRTRVVVDVPDEYIPDNGDDFSTKFDNVVIAKADDRILAEAQNYITGDNVTYIMEDEECPAGTLSDD